MSNIARLFQAFVAPAIFFSATALLILSINVRLMGIVAKLRYFVHAKHDAAKGGRLEEAEAYTSQIQSIEKRAEMIRRAFLFSLLGLVGTLMACLLLGLGLYFKATEIAAAIIFISLHGIWPLLNAQSRMPSEPKFLICMATPIQLLR
jgi:Protein of unknown function (DUF2721)